MRSKFYLRAVAADSILDYRMRHADLNDAEAGKCLVENAHRSEGMAPLPR